MASVRIDFREDVLMPLCHWAEGGQGSVLLTLVAVHGSSPRPAGSQMAVRGDGVAEGFITGGCAEAALICEALDVLKEGMPRLVRYGAGSPYLDIQLPCGSGIEVLFTPNPLADCHQCVAQALGNRQSFQLRLAVPKKKPEKKPEKKLEPPVTFSADPKQLCPALGETCFVRAYEPVPQLVVAGRGVAAVKLARMAHEAGFGVKVASPEAEVLTAATALGAEGIHLKSPEGLPVHWFDAHVAFVTLFHDHEWEPDLLKTALAADCFYIGALGSRRTHSERLSILRQMGIEEHQLERIEGPVGLDIGARNPAEIAVSVTASLIQHYRRMRDMLDGTDRRRAEI